VQEKAPAVAFGMTFILFIFYFYISFPEVKVVVPDYQTQILNPESVRVVLWSKKEFEPSLLLEVAVDSGSNS
jgi:hypothetical protein